MRSKAVSFLRLDQWARATVIFLADSRRQPGPQAACGDLNIPHNEINYRILKNYGTPDTLRAIEIPSDFAVR